MRLKIFSLFFLMVSEGGTERVTPQEAFTVIANIILAIGIFAFGYVASYLSMMLIMSSKKLKTIPFFSFVVTAIFLFPFYGVITIETAIIFIFALVVASKLDQFLSLVLVLEE